MPHAKTIPCPVVSVIQSSDSRSPDGRTFHKNIGRASVREERARAFQRCSPPPYPSAHGSHNDEFGEAYRCRAFVFELGRCPALRSIRREATSSRSLNACRPRRLTGGELPLAPAGAAKDPAIIWSENLRPRGSP